MTIKYTSSVYRVCVGTLVLLVLLVPSYTFASHRSTSRINTSSLGSEIVDDLAIPILFGVTLDDIEPNFGDPRDGGARSHEGQDIMAPRGTPIVSPTKAIVTSFGLGESAGRYVYTANPGGESFRYMHLQSIADIKVGDKLAAGDFIGTVGDSGNAQGAGTHLHFEVRDGREAIDPFPRLTKEFSFKEQMSFLDDVFDKVSDPGDYAELLVEQYPSELRRALNEGYDLPRVLVNELKSENITSNVSIQQQLDALIDTIPRMFTRTLKEGESGVEVALLQIYLQYRAPDKAGVALRAAGITSYFGTATRDAVIAYQIQQKLEPTGEFDKATREKAARYSK